MQLYLTDYSNALTRHSSARFRAASSMHPGTVVTSCSPPAMQKVVTGRRSHVAPQEINEVVFSCVWSAWTVGLEFLSAKALPSCCCSAAGAGAAEAPKFRRFSRLKTYESVTSPSDALRMVSARGSGRTGTGHGRSSWPQPAGSLGDQRWPASVPSANQDRRRGREDVH